MLGKGAFGKVYAVQLAADKNFVRVVKEMSKTQIIQKGENTVNLLVFERHILTGRFYFVGFLLWLAFWVGVLRIRARIFLFFTFMLSELRFSRSCICMSFSDASLELANCPFVVKSYCSTQDTQHLYLLLEFCPGGELDFHLCNLKHMPENHVRFYAAELIVALDNMHRRYRVVHRSVFLSSSSKLTID